MLAHVKRKCKTRIEIVGAGSPRPQSVRVGGPNPYEDSVAVVRFLNMNQSVFIVDYYGSKIRAINVIKYLTLLRSVPG